MKKHLVFIKTFETFYKMLQNMKEEKNQCSKILMDKSLNASHSILASQIPLDLMPLHLFLLCLV